MFAYDIFQLRNSLAEFLSKSASPEHFEWLRAESYTSSSFIRNFSLASRKLANQKKVFDPEQVLALTANFPQTNWTNWNLMEMARLYQLSQLETRDKSSYIQLIENLFQQGDLNELTILYKALPFYAYANEWTGRCAEGIRSNMGTVLEAIMYENPYPEGHLSEAAWNQMILKAIFTDKTLTFIQGLDKRNNERLATSLLDFAEERLAAGRQVDPEIWRLTSSYFPEKTGLLQSKFIHKIN